MPVSALHHRALTGANEKFLHKKLGKNTPRARNINSENSILPAEILHFGRYINLVVNSPEKWVNRSFEPPVIAPFLLLLSQISLPSVTPTILFSESEGSIIPPVSVRVGCSDDSNNGFGALWHPVANSIYKVGALISKYDPLRFPSAEALPVRKGGMGDDFTDSRFPRYAVFQKKTTTPSPVMDDVEIKSLVHSCVEERRELSISDVFRQIGKTLSNPVSELAKESQVIHYYNNYHRCPTEREILNLNSITSVVDQVITQVMSLIPHGNVFVVIQRVGGGYSE